jgi:Predicted membrane protein
MKERRKHELADTAQQIVGGFLLSGPFVVTEEVWMLARNMTIFHSLFLVSAVMAIGYGGRVRRG